MQNPSGTILLFKLRSRDLTITPVMLSGRVLHDPHTNTHPSGSVLLSELCLLLLHFLSTFVTKKSALLSGQIPA